MQIRKATSDDIPKLATVIRESVRGLARGSYDDRQIELSITSVFGVDTDLIEDGTYFVAEIDGEIVGCGGWSKRKTLYGASVYSASREPEFLDPAADAAKIRAFFVHPRAARKGLGAAILERCEDEAMKCGFSTAEMMSTLPGVPLYSAKGYSGDEEVEIAVGEGVSIICIRMAKSLV
ncbi:MAG TPA: GNAT family N-acetyltransferase [Pyrinomonadaceae bacterium]|nr:GNAT family N-acetyltransferase [Pyrinomonadaceae bacterium]